MPLDNELAGYPALSSDHPLLAEESTASVTRPPVDPNNPPWGFGSALLVWLFSIVVQLIMQIVIFAGYLIYSGWSPTSPNAGAALSTLAIDKTSIFLQIFSLLPAHLLTFAVVWLIVTQSGKYPFFKTIGWEWPGRYWPWLSLGLGVVLFGAGMGVANLIGAEKTTTLEQIINSSLAARYTIAFLAVFTAPFIEEFIYRGVLFGAVHRLAGGIVASVTTLGLFTLIHVPQYWPNFGVIAAVGFLSVALTVIRARTGRLLPCVVIHFVFNGIQSAYLIVEPHLGRTVPVPEPAPSLVALLLGLF